jgi:hypothetical protein
MTRGNQTDYAGTTFRSRLEARWAKFFDLCGWRWTYEPLDLAGYIPDFLLHIDSPVLVEVKPCVAWDDFYQAAADLESRTADWSRRVVLVGISPLLLEESHPQFALGWMQLGLCREKLKDGWRWTPAFLFRCAECSLTGERTITFRADRTALLVDGTVIEPASLVCGHGGPDGEPSWLLPDEVDHLWRQAGNEVRWRPAGGRWRTESDRWRS